MRGKMRSKFIKSALVMLVVLLSALPITKVKAAHITGYCGEMNVCDSDGKYGTNAQFSFENGVLMISGTGRTEFYESYTDANGDWITVYGLDFFERKGIKRSEIKKCVVENGITTIGDYFIGVENNTGKPGAACGVKEVVIPNSVTKIGNYSFEGCTGITSLTLPSSLTTMGPCAFSGCTGITTLTLPSSLTTMGPCAFSGCTGITTLTLPSGLKTIEYGAFSGCTGITTLTLPSGLKTIEYGAFSGCTGITTLTLPSGLKTIEYDAFSGCTGITTLTLPSGLKTIEYNAFSGCTGITSLTLPNGLLTIGDSAFSDCKKLTSVNIPDSVTQIGGYAFSSCTNLNTVSFGKCKASIGTSSFLGCVSLRKVILPDTIKEIGSSAFSNCNSLEEIRLPGNITVIREYTFNGCEKLTKITLPDSVTDLEESATNWTITDIVLSKNLKTIGQYALPCNVKEYILPSSLKTVESYAICSGWNERIVLPQSLDELGAKAFGDTSYQGDYLAGNRSVPVTYPYIYCATAEQKAYCESNGYTYIDGSSSRSISAAEILFDDSFSVYSGSEIKPAFKVIFNNGKEDVFLKEGFDYTVEYSDNVNPGKGTVTIKGIDFWTGTASAQFDICVDMNTCSMSLAETNFLYNGSAKEPAVTVTYNGQTLIKDTDYTVEYVNNVTPGIATAQVTGINQYTGTIEKQFEITGISISKADVSLKECIYSYDGSPKTPPVAVSLNGAALTQDVDFTVAYENNVADGTAHAVITGIGIYTDIVKVSYVILPYNAGMDAVYPEGTMIDGSFVFGVTDDETNEVELFCPASKNLKNVNIPATITDENGVVYSVTSIGNKAFYKNTKITGVTIGNNVKSIEDYAFYGCKNVKSFKLGKSVEIIGNSAFRKCTKLTDVTLPKSMDTLGKNAFYGCTKLKNITINANSVVDVKSNAIKGVSKKCVIKVPKKLVNKYKKEFNKKSGFKKGMNIKKK